MIPCAIVPAGCKVAEYLQAREFNSPIRRRLNQINKIIDMITDFFKETVLNWHGGDHLILAFFSDEWGEALVSNRVYLIWIYIIICNVLIMQSRQEYKEHECSFYETGSLQLEEIDGVPLVEWDDNAEVESHSPR